MRSGSVIARRGGIVGQRCGPRWQFGRLLPESPPLLPHPCGTLKRVGADALITETVDRTGLWEAQTPQVFRRDLLEKAYAAARGSQPTDEASMVEALGQQVTVVPGSPINLKITSREDLKLAEHALKALSAPKLSGPAHPFAGDDLWR